MKKLLITFSCTTLIISCNNSLGSQKNAGAENATTGSSSTTSTGSKSGTITCTLDGKQKAFDLRGFTEINLDPYSKGPKDGILFTDGDSKKEGFQLEIKKSGTTKIKSNAAGDMNCIINYYNPQGIVYTGDDVTVIVSSYNGSKLSGTFSGKLVNVYFQEGKNEKNYPEFIQITDGKFEMSK